MQWLIALTLALLLTGGPAVAVDTAQRVADETLSAELNGWLADIEAAITSGALAGTAAVRALREHNEALRDARVELFGTDPFMRFRLKYLSHRMRDRTSGLFVPPAWFHYRITDDLDSLIRGRSEIDHMVAELSRAFAKSTVGTEDFALYCAAEELSLNTALIGASSQEKEYLTRMGNIIAELDGNLPLLSDYPGLSPQRDKKGQLTKYTDSVIVLENDCRIGAMPFGGNVRGQSWRSNRPRLAILDDPETRKMVRSKDLLAQGRDWIDNDLIGSEGAEGMAIVWFGTLLSYDCLLRWISLPPERGGKGWTGPSGEVLRVPMLRRDGDFESSNWPEYFTAKRCERIFNKHGPRAFAIERQLDVRPGEDAVYHEEWFWKHTFSSKHLSRNAGRWELNGVPLSIYGAIDQAIGEEEEHAKSAFVIVGIDDSENVYVLEAVNERISFPKQCAKVEMLCDKWRPLAFGWEDVAYQRALSQQILTTRALPLVGIKRSTAAAAKEERLERHAVHWFNGKVYHDPDDPVQRDELLLQALEFPLGKLVDLLDAEETAVSLALKRKRGGGDSFSGSQRREAPDATEGVGW